MILLPLALLYALFTGDFIHTAACIILWCVLMVALEGM
jgi:hypothetical protein